MFSYLAQALCCACRVVLRGRCDHFRARCDSGMRDAEDREIHVPEHFSKASLEQNYGPCTVWGLRKIQGLHDWGQAEAQAE